MDVDHLLILYPDGRDKDPSGETKNSAEALLHKHSAKIQSLAEGLAMKEGAQSKARTGTMMSAKLVRFDFLNKGLRFVGDQVEKGKLTDKAFGKAQQAANAKEIDEANAGAESVRKAWKKDPNKDDRPLTWGVYVVIHGSGGEPSLVDKHQANHIAELIKKAEPKKGKWKLKKVCIVACTLGHIADKKTGSYVKRVCDALQWEGALIGGYSAQVFVGEQNHIARQPSYAYTYGTPEIAHPENRGRKFIQLPDKHPNFMSGTDGVARMTDEYRANYKVAWRWDGTQSTEVDVMTEWYHK